MNAQIREALKSLGQALGNFEALMDIQPPDEILAIHNPGEFQEASRQFDNARASLLPNLLYHLLVAQSRLDRSQKELKSAIKALRAMIDAQERMLFLANLAEPESPNWRAEYQDCLERNRRSGQDLDKHFGKASHKLGFTYDAGGIHF